MTLFNLFASPHLLAIDRIGEKNSGDVRYQARFYNVQIIVYWHNLAIILVQVDILSVD